MLMAWRNQVLSEKNDSRLTERKNVSKKPTLLIESISNIK